MERCMTLSFNAAISVFNYLILFFFFARKITKYEFLQSSHIKIRNRLLHTNVMYFKISTIQIEFLNILNPSFFVFLYEFAYILPDNVENRTKWAEMILIMRWETSDWNMNDFKFRFLLQHLLNINQNFKVCLKKLRL